MQHEPVMTYCTCSECGEMFLTSSIFSDRVCCIPCLEKAISRVRLQEIENVARNLLKKSQSVTKGDA